MEIENPVDTGGPARRSVKVKICGLTKLEDALAAAEEGADYLGFVFYAKSKRAIAESEVRSITSVIGSRAKRPLLVGVFVDSDVEQIRRILDSCILDLAQLSGDEPPAYIGDLSSPIYGRSYKALKPTSLAAARADSEWYIPPGRDEDVPSLLIDAYHPTMPGGTGLTADWEIASKLSSEVPGLMLAGGLNPHNLAKAISQVKPFAVDVSGGVESSPGKKDHKLIRDFIQVAHGM